MAKRDPNKTARNRIIEKIKTRLREILPDVLQQTGLRNEQSLNAKIGSKHDKFIDLRNEVIYSQDHFVNLWLKGLKNSIDQRLSSSHLEIYTYLKSSPAFKEYLLLFLKRSYLKHFDELSKKRPRVEEAEIWIGQTNANYGLLVTPRFRNNQWENDKSEIRTFKEGYWTIGHIMKTGLVIPAVNNVFTFKDLDQYLIFFKETLVRNSGSQYQYEIAGHYCDFVRASANPYKIPLFIPEFRYRGLDKKHKYRLDFLIINPFTLNKIGFELSPWSTHGYLRQTRKLKQWQINEMAKDNFEKEMKKHRDFFKQHNIFVLIYTDQDLVDCNSLFQSEVKPYLEPENPSIQLSFQIMEEFI